MRGLSVPLALITISVMAPAQITAAAKPVRPRLELLRRVPLFAGVDHEELEAIGQIVDEIEAPAGTMLTHEGRHEGYFFVIVSGSVRVERAGRTIKTLGEGDFLGEIALIDGGPRTATVTTVTSSTLLRMTHTRFHQLLDESPSIRIAVLRELGRRLRSLDTESVH
jgi:CRP/FNR family transcriptional regulator, cyclic AMP receptor protein